MQAFLQKNQWKTTIREVIYIPILNIQYIKKGVTTKT